MQKALLRRIVTIIACLACALALTLAAYRHIAKPAQREDDVPDAVVEVLERAAGEESDVASPAAQDDAQAAAEGQQDDASSGQDAVAAVSQCAGDEMPTDEEPHVFTMPEGAAYVEGVALLQVGEDATAQEVNELLAQTPGVVAHEVGEDELASGLIEVEVAEGSTVEDVVNELLASPVAEGAQPNFEYVIMAGDASDLRAIVGEALDPEPEPLELAPEGEADAEAGAIGEGAENPMPEEPEPEASAQDEVQAPASEDPEGTVDNAADDAAAEESVGEDAEASSAEDAEDPEGSATDGAEEPTENTEESTGADAEAPADEGAKTPVGEPTGELSDAPAEDAKTPADDDDADVSTGADVESSANPADPQLGAQELLAAVSVNDPLLKGITNELPNDWGLTSTRAYQAWGLARCNGQVTVAVLDTGFQASHEDLKANVRVTYNAVTGTSDVTPISKSYNHGTHVAGIVSARANNGVGVAGVSYDAGLMLIKVATDSGSLNTKNLVKAYDYVMQNASAYNVRVVNVSMGVNTNQVDLALNNKMTEAFDRGIVTVAAAGNSDITGGVLPYAEYPGDEASVVSVINLQQKGSSLTRYATSNYNLPGMSNKNVSAPGTDIHSTIPTNGYSTMTGTSMAAPFVSGILALEFAAEPSLTASEAVSCLYASATDLGARGFDEEYGWGKADAYAAVYLAKNGTLPKDTSADDQAAAANAVAAAAVQSKIDGLPDATDVTRADNAAIKEARASYNSLTSAQKKLVNVARLEAAEKALASQAATVTRLWGQNAYDTMRAIVSSGAGFASGRGGTVIVATGEGYWDALAASGLAGVCDAPVLITQRAALSAQTKAEIQRLKPTRILVMGGPAAVSDAVMGQLKSASGVTPTRVYGQTAPDTAVKIYQKGSGSWGHTAIVATANGYWDALSVAPYAYAQKAPIFLTNYSDNVSARKLSDAALAALKGGGFTRVLVIGGTAAIPASVETQLKGIGITTVRRLWGQTAIDTSVAVAQFCLAEGMQANGMGVATSGGYWDALTGAALCGRQNAVLVLVANEKSPSITTFVKANRMDIAQLYVFGGNAAVSAASVDAIKAALK